MRLNKFISSTGMCSRRQADELIREKRVTINGQIATVGQSVNIDDKVCVDRKLLKQKKNDVYIILNKPRGITCTTERHIEGNIIDFVNHSERIFPVGRLDKDSEGLILLTNDGDIVNKILREENNKKKEYIVTVNKPITQSFIKGMANGVKIYNPVRNEYTITKKCELVKIKDNTFKITLSQGLNRQIRRMCSHFGYNVIKLKRVKIMDLTLGNLKIGEWRNLSSEEIENIKSKLS
ncbi:pseudouridine synthase [Asaccharospora irregularis]|uniref:Pseudouridine synthase n=1 Tax=Asaccharospora irregularis DSM 2635 TaxID=1121321 RepID=A0A1M5LB16_9FIRM|nr:pseudouridine synthase [Asaccharospora irregularis]SHG62221.1 ribosomal large subunit pseudouridine synthase F [Asaccharospora irregularis DSM 2635]